MRSKSVLYYNPCCKHNILSRVQSKLWTSLLKFYKYSSATDPAQVNSWSWCHFRRQLVISVWLAWRLITTSEWKASSTVTNTFTRNQSRQPRKRNYWRRLGAENPFTVRIGSGDAGHWNLRSTAKPRSVVGLQKLCSIINGQNPESVNPDLIDMCMLNHCLECDKWVLTTRQWFNTLIPPSYESIAVYFVCRTFGNCDFTLEWTREVISKLYHARHPL